MKCQKRKKYDAYQFDGSLTSMLQIQAIFPDMQNASSHSNTLNRVNWWSINAYKGKDDIHSGDFILRDKKGRFKVLSPKEFYKKFEWTKPR